MRIFLLLFIVSLTSVAEAAQPTFRFQSYELPKQGRLVIPVLESEELQGVAAAINEVTDGAVARAAKEAEFSGEQGKTVTLLGTILVGRLPLHWQMSGVVKSIFSGSWTMHRRTLPRPGSLLDTHFAAIVLIAIKRRNWILKHCPPSICSAMTTPGTSMKAILRISLRASFSPGI